MRGRLSYHRLISMQLQLKENTRTATAVIFWCTLQASFVSRFNTNCQQNFLRSSKSQCTRTCILNLCTCTCIKLLHVHIDSARLILCYGAENICMNTVEMKDAWIYMTKEYCDYWINNQQIKTSLAWDLFCDKGCLSIQL